MEFGWLNQSLLKPLERLLMLHYRPTTKLPVLLANQCPPKPGHNCASPICNARETAPGQQPAKESRFSGHCPETASIFSSAQTSTGMASEPCSRMGRLPQVDHGVRGLSFGPSRLAGLACEAKPRCSPWGTKGSSPLVGMNVQVPRTFLHLASRPL